MRTARLGLGYRPMMPPAQVAAGRVGRRAHRPAGPGRLAGRDAGHRPQGTPPPRRAAAVHRHRRPPVHRLRHRRPGRASSPTWNYATAAGPAARTGSAAPRTPALRNLPLHGFAQNQIWCEVVALACELLAWMQMLALDRHRPPLGTQTAAAADVLRRRAPGPRRPPPAAPPRRDLALGRQITAAITRLHAFAPG